VFFSGFPVKDSRDPVVKGTFRVSAATSKKSLKIVDKSEKSKTNFVGFVVKKSIFSRKDI
jgi:hypothetical protein